MRALALLPVLLCGCVFTGWRSEGPWACEPDGGCAEGLTCDDGVCCQPGGEPECPTLPSNGSCPPGSDPQPYYFDGDGDRAGATATGRIFCRPPQNGSWVTQDNDCDDLDPLIGPLMNERCNARDDNCNGETDEGLPLEVWYLDEDGDDFGTSVSTTACIRPDGYAPRGGDCDDGDATIFPGAVELCDGVDNNCNGQPDDGPFGDSENPGSGDGRSFPCETGRLGVCAEGGWQCLPTTSGDFQRVCVPRLLPSTDVCDDGLDNDCDGTTDNPPGCGGPRDFITAPGVSIGAFSVHDGGDAPPPGCLRDEESEKMAWLAPSWIGTNTPSGLHVLHADAPAGTFWDLRKHPTLHLSLFSTYVSGTSFWNAPGRMATLTVQLCGANGTFLRLTPSGPALLGATNQTRDVPLLGNANWQVTNGGLDLGRVDRLELLAAPSPSNTFRNTFDTDGGFGFVP